MFQNQESGHFAYHIKPDRHGKHDKHGKNDKDDKDNKDDTPETISFREKLIVQGIISGIIFTVVLVLNLTDHPQAANIVTNLNQAISGNITIEQVAIEVRRFLGEDLGDADTPIGYDALEFQSLPIEGQTVAPRIDEDMLREIFGWTDSDDLQTTAPEPITLPEL